METELCSSRVLSPPRYESGDEELSVLPRHTKVIVTGNNRTKSVLVGLQGVVKKAVGLGGWHWLVLKNGVEVKLQRNALSVLEPPTESKPDKTWNSYAVEILEAFQSCKHEPQSIKGTALPWGPAAFSVSVLTSGSNLFQMLNKKQQLDELQVILGFIQAAKRLKTLYRS
uniref:OSJNBb0115I21.12 protein n=1 Tax=Oryza sativa subsp. japonica TaxID=39947 RepID=Q7XX75_ORYSJ|nr:OSJNBb0115I21.12 [Oryza sativa Japonica Group]